jgi:GNAT superfamily N-acetyltransferase
MTRAWYPTLYTDEDLEELVAFSQRQPGKASAITADYIRWQRSANPAGLAQVALAKDEESGKIIGVVCVVPLRIKVRDKVQLGSQTLYGLVHPDWRGQGVFTNLSRFCYQRARSCGVQFSYGFPNPNSYGPMVHRLGWLDIGEAELFIHPVSIDRLTTRRLGHGLLQRVVSTIGRAGGPLLFRPQPLAPGASQVAVAEVDTQDGALDDFWRRVREKYPVMLVRDTSFLHWRYTKPPARTYRVLTGRRNGTVIAIAVLRTTLVERIPCGMIVDFLVEPTERGRTAGEVLLRQTLDRFQHDDVDLIGCLMSPGAEETALLRSQGYLACLGWFQPRPFPVVLLTDENTPARAVLCEFRSWFVTMGDYDAV